MSEAHKALCSIYTSLQFKYHLPSDFDSLSRATALLESLDNSTEFHKLTYEQAYKEAIDLLSNNML